MSCLQHDLKEIAALFAWRAAVSAVAGLLVSTFATAALAVGRAGSADRLELGHTISGSLAPMLWAIAGAGLAASTIVFLCLLMNDLRRWLGPWLVARRRYALVPFRAITWVIARGALAAVVALQVMARSAVVVETIWLARTVGRPFVLVLAWVTAVGFAALIYVGIIVAGFACVRLATDIVVAILDDPPRQPAMTFGLALAASVMYVGLGAFALCGWLTYRVMRGAVQWVSRTRMVAWRG